MWKSKFYGTFVQNRRVVLRAMEPALFIGCTRHTGRFPHQVNILEDAPKDAQKKTMLEDYSVDPAALRR